MTPLSTTDARLRRFDVGDRVMFQGELCEVWAVRGRSNPDWIGDSGFVRVLEPAPGSHRTVGTSLFAWASDCQGVPR